MNNSEKAAQVIPLEFGDPDRKPRPKPEPKETKIAIQYPPTYDELHIKCSSVPACSWTEHTFSFTVADNMTPSSNSDPWDVLVQVAKDILAQEERRKRNG